MTTNKWERKGEDERALEELECYVVRGHIISRLPMSGEGMSKLFDDMGDMGIMYRSIVEGLKSLQTNNVVWWDGENQMWNFSEQLPI